MLKRLRNYIGEFRAYNKERRQVTKSAEIGKKDRLAARIVRFVHSIEKGLSIESPRPGFGYDKIEILYGWIKEYLNLEGVDKTPVYMAADALKAYCKYHDEIGFATEKIVEIKNICDELTNIKTTDGIKGEFGGVTKICKKDMVFDIKEIEKLFNTRHSVRQFTKEPVSVKLIEKAIQMAQTAPSACNRQGVRAYVIDSKKFIDIYSGQLQGIGGFADDCDKVILITGKISAYEDYEYKQFIVSAGIFTGYLTLSLHSLNLGACVVQRSLRPDKTWTEFCKKNNISLDEQLICLVMVGCLKEETTVPLSKRYSTETIVKEL